MDQTVMNKLDLLLIINFSTVVLKCLSSKLVKILCKVVVLVSMQFVIYQLHLYKVYNKKRGGAMLTVKCLIDLVVRGFF